MASAHEEIPTLRDVECRDGVCGKIVSVVIDPVQESVTHIVVKTHSPVAERLVPASAIEGDTEGNIRLRLSKSDVANLEKFEVADFIKPGRKVPRANSTLLPYGAMGMPGFTGANAFYWPIAVPFGKRTEAFRHENIPQGQLAIRRGTRVEATDGSVGTVDEFVVDPDTCTISHLVLREANRKDVAIPYSAITSTGEKIVFLSLSKKQVEALPAIELLRRWDNPGAK
jgi:sporulation protein YlmC with PRC-barrel domain